MDIVNAEDSPPLEFELRVARRYQWVDWLGEDRAPVVLSPEELQSSNAVQAARQAVGPVLSAEGQVRKLHPTPREFSNLFLAFGSLDYTDRDAILRFSSHYGFLGVKPDAQVVTLSDGTQHYASGEFYSEWAREIVRMQEAIQLWESPHRKRTDHDRSRLEWLVNANAQHAHRLLKFNASDHPELSFGHITLLTAMWDHFARAIARGKRFVRCKFCRRLLELSTDEIGYRTNRTFCSESCKTRDYRKRKRTTLRLAGEGQAVSTIAKEVQTTPATVRAWIDKAKGSC